MNFSRAASLLNDGQVIYLTLDQGLSQGSARSRIAAILKGAAPEPRYPELLLVNRLPLSGGDGRNDPVAGVCIGRGQTIDLEPVILSGDMRNLEPFAGSMLCPFSQGGRAFATGIGGYVFSKVSSTYTYQLIQEGSLATPSPESVSLVSSPYVAWWAPKSGGPPLTTSDDPMVAPPVSWQSRTYYGGHRDGLGGAVDGNMEAYLNWLRANGMTNANNPEYKQPFTSYCSAALASAECPTDPRTGAKMPDCSRYVSGGKGGQVCRDAIPYTGGADSTLNAIAEARCPDDTVTSTTKKPDCRCVSRETDPSYIDLFNTVQDYSFDPQPACWYLPCTQADKYLVPSGIRDRGGQAKCPDVCANVIWNEGEMKDVKQEVCCAKGEGTSCTPWDKYELDKTIWWWVGGGLAAFLILFFLYRIAFVTK